jgi:GrpB-like predicted nucleotidyltransferase (UPF0157 family)
MAGPADASEPPLTREEQLAAVRVGELQALDGPILLVDYDPEWPRLYRREADRIRSALGARALLLAHVGSTAVPGLAAKPIVDIVLAVADSAAEDQYVPSLEEVGYVLRIREPDWYEHRVLKGPDTDVNVHVFSQGSEEIERMLLFRDRLRRNEGERELYERTKRKLAAREWKYTQDYADAKSEVVEGIIARTSRPTG